MKRIIAILVLALFVATSARADISFIGGGSGSGGGGGGATIVAGTWTPGVAGSTGAGTAVYSNQIGNYLEITSNGETFVLVTFFITTTSFTGATGSLNITGLPVTPTQANNFYSGDIANTQGITLTANYTIIGTQTAPNSTSLSVIQSGSAQNAAFIPVSGAASALQLIGTTVYRAS